MTNISNDKLTDTSNNYTTLLVSFPPRPIKCEKDLEKTQEIVDDLIDKGELTEAEEDYLSLLGMLIYEYEEKQEIIADIFGVDLLKVLLEELELKQKDLVPIFKTESIVSDVLNGKRKLTVKHIQGLAKFFNISPSVFFPKNPTERALIEKS